MQLAAIVAKLIALWRNSTVRGMTSVFLIRAATTLLNLALVTLAARSLGQHDFGVYSVLFSAAGLCSVVATFGQQIFLMRAWSEYTSQGAAGLLKGAMLFSGAACVAGCTLVAIAFYVYFSRSHSQALTVAVTLYLVALSVMLTTSHLVRTAISVTMGDGFSYLVLIIPAIIYLTVRLASGAPVDIDVVFLLMADGAAVAVAIHLIRIRAKLRSRFPDFAGATPAFDTRQWLARSVKLWISNGLEAANQYADVIIIGFLMSPSVAGAYFVTTRIANAFAMATGAIYMFSMRHIPNLYYRRQYGELNAILDFIALVTLGIIAAGLLVIVAGGHWILSAFSPDYVSSYGPLVLLSVGTAAIAAAGPSGPILMLTGHEGRYLAIVGGTALSRAVGFFVLIPAFGILGAVSATAISFIWMAVMLRTSAKMSAGIDGSVLRLLDRLRRSRVSLPAE